MNGQETNVTETVCTNPLHKFMSGVNDLINQLRTDMEAGGYSGKPGKTYLECGGLIVRAQLVEPFQHQLDVDAGKEAGFECECYKKHNIDIGIANNQVAGLAMKWADEAMTPPNPLAALFGGGE